MIFWMIYKTVSRACSQIPGLCLCLLPWTSSQSSMTSCRWLERVEPTWVPSNREHYRLWANRVSNTHTHTHTHTFILLQLLMKSGQILKHLVLCIAKLVNSCKEKLNDWGYVHTSSIGLKQFYRNYQWHKCTLIGQAHTKRRLPGIFRKPCKNIYSTNMENNDNGI